MKGHIVIRSVSKFLIPFIQLYALYVLAHGEVGPGGGFQGGVIMGASIILYVLAHDLRAVKKRINDSMIDILICLGVCVFALVGILCMLFGGNFLQYDALPLHGGHGGHLASALGMYGIEIGVFITVTSVMILIFFETARKDNG